MHWWKFIIRKRGNKKRPAGRLVKLVFRLFLGLLKFVKGFDLFLTQGAIIDPDIVNCAIEMIACATVLRSNFCCHVQVVENCESACN